MEPLVAAMEDTDDATEGTGDIREAHGDVDVGLQAQVMLDAGERATGGDLDARLEGDAVDEEEETTDENVEMQEIAEALMESRTPTTFRRRFTKSTTSCQPGAVPNPLLQCCNRCKSDLNKKLLVRCTTCSFRRHLYCFTPPLRQHPAVLRANALQRQQGIAALVDKWTCDDCTAKARASPPTGPSSGEPKTSPTKRSQWHLRARGRRGKPTLVIDDLSSPDDPVGLPSDGAPQEIEREQEGARDMDWHTFRKAKAAALRRAAADESKPTDVEITRQAQNQLEELVFYSRSYVLMKKTAMLWHRQTEQHRRFVQQRLALEQRLRMPTKRNVMHNLTDADRERMERTRERQARDEADEEMLFDDSLYYHFNPDKPVFETLRRRRPAIVPVVEDINSQAAKAREDLLVVLREMEENVGMSIEDRDVGANTSGEISVDQHPCMLGLYVAARIIQVACGRWLQRAKRAAEVRRNIEERERQRQMRRHRARAKIGILRYCIRFLVVMVEKLRNVQIKKELLMHFQDAAEDKHVLLQSAADAAAARRELAQRRIQRFFVRRVRPYIELKKKVMSRRLVLWWRYKYLPMKFRELALTVRFKHRTNASRRIQRCYRWWHTRKRFRDLLEKHAIKRVQTFLRGWLTRRLARKEKHRKAVYDAAIALQVATDKLWNRPQAAVIEVVVALGLGFFRSGDFWNAAAFLHRASVLKADVLEASARISLAYAHHMCWYGSYDPFNLTQADDVYCVALDAQTKTEPGASVDPYILLDVAVVKMHLGEYRTSLRLLAKIIEFFPDHDCFLMVLLLAGVQLQQVGEWEQSSEYLMYLQDMPPPPYLERDVMALCAMSCERVKSNVARVTGREAWQAALRLWNLENKVAKMEYEAYYGQQVWASESPAGAGGAAEKKLQLSVRRKWKMLLDLAQRTTTQGHYLVACRVLLHALTECAEFEDDSDVRRVWWDLGELFRHLNQTDLYVDALERSQPPDDVADPQQIASRAAARRKEWLTFADNAAKSFRIELDAPLLDKLQELVARSQMATTTATSSGWATS
ncbi:TPA: hypothetical protein N0F65_005186 [Lagenidium giganteum]|uniref:Zinc finger PHD-type domain-containing protein n=1 Tax=Lagenidium giganteum TaxID=4803 RepID=A0AAV2YWK3_9STRA|nr:TPA: hypothetical protein N0F65_005186 [Lagenidium giganteum]